MRVELSEGVLEMRGEEVVMWALGKGMSENSWVLRMRGRKGFLTKRNS